MNVKDLKSEEIVASMKTRRALEWKAWLEKPRSINATAASGMSGGIELLGPNEFTLDLRIGIAQ